MGRAQKRIRRKGGRKPLPAVTTPKEGVGVSKFSGRELAGEGGSPLPAGDPEPRVVRWPV